MGLPPSPLTIKDPMQQVGYLESFVNKTDKINSEIFDNFF